MIELANQYRLDFVGLSFVRTPENVKEAKSLLSESVQIISKIETTDAVEHINEIPHTYNGKIDRKKLLS